MKKKFVTNLAFLLGINLLIKPFWIFGIDRSVQNAIGADQYGMYYALFNFSFLFNILLDLGITNYNNRNISQNEHLLNKHFSGIMMLRIFLTVIYLLISLIIALLLGYSLINMKLLLVLLLNQVLLSFVLYFRSNLGALQMFKTDSLVSVLDKTMMILICGILLWTNITHGHFQIEWFVWAQTFSYLVAALIAFAILWSKTSLFRLNWNIPFFIMILKQSYPYAILILLMTFSFRIDSVMLERLLPDGALQAGIYAQAFRLLDAAAILAYLFAGLLLPMFARMIKQKQNIEDLTKLSFSLIIVPSVLAAACSMAYAGKIMNLLYDHHATESAHIVGIVMCSFVALSSSYIFGTLLTANGNLKYLNYTALGGMFLNISLNLILIPQYKALGASVSCLITQAATAFAQIIITQKIFRIKTNVSYVSRLLVFVIISLSICFWMSQLKVDWLLSLSVSAFSCLAFAFLIKLIKLKDLFFFTVKPD